MEQVRIALTGDYSPDVTAHGAIPQTLQISSVAVGCEVEADWVETENLKEDVRQQLGPYHGIWCVPASPYKNMDGALRAIRFAREHGRPFLGTCGGFQHALLEYARNVLNLAGVGHAEANPEAPSLLITPLVCSLVEKQEVVILTLGSRIATIYGSPEAKEQFHCNYGLNPGYRVKFDAGLDADGMEVSGMDKNSEARAAELRGHPFFIATLFQPERSALARVAHPLVNAYVRSALAFKSARETSLM